MSTIFHIKIGMGTASAIFINPSTAKLLDVSHKKKGFVSFGTRKHYVYIEISEKIAANDIILTSNLVEHLQLPLYPRYEVKIKDNEIAIGPFIGILISKEGNKITKKILKKMLNYTLQYSSINGALVVFSLDNIDTVNRMIKGYCYNPETDFWQEGKFPYPHAIYKKISLNEFWKNYFLSNIGDTVFNNYCFNRWEIYSWLSSSSLVSKYIPHTVLYEDYGDIINMLIKYEKVLVKPIEGKQEKEIVKISYFNKQFRFNYRYKGESKEISLDEISNAKQIIYNLFRCKKHVIQQHIELLKYDNRVVSFRVIVQRDENNTWICNGIIARIGSGKSIENNISISVTTFGLYDLCKKVLALDETRIFLLKESLASFAIEICNHVDIYGVNCGTLAIDVGIDTDKKLWLLEVESKELDAAIALDAKDKYMYYRIKSAPLFYGKWLSGFSQRG